MIEPYYSDAADQSDATTLCGNCHEPQPVTAAGLVRFHRLGRKGRCPGSCQPPDGQDVIAPTPAGFCRCGCGSSVGRQRSFVSGHNLRVMVRTDEHRAAISAACTEAWATKRERKPLGSRRLDSRGYWLIKVREHGGRWDKEHVLVVEEQIGRRLTASEVVHHVNAIKTDNGPENLILCATPSEHQAMHASFDALLPELLAAGVIVFDRAERRYRRA